jgi:hypothetical protein
VYQRLFQIKLQRIVNHVRTGYKGSGMIEITLAGPSRDRVPLGETKEKSAV